MMDLDHFKAVNDTVGHQEGDKVLRAVAAVLRRCSRESDFVARYGGEEFAMFLPHATVDEACQVAERIRSLVARDRDPGDHGLQVSVSVGVAQFPSRRARQGRHHRRGRRGAAVRQGARPRPRLRRLADAEATRIAGPYSVDSAPGGARPCGSARSLGLDDAECAALSAAL